MQIDLVRDFIRRRLGGAFEFVDGITISGPGYEYTEHPGTASERYALRRTEGLTRRSASLSLYEGNQNFDTLAQLMDGSFLGLWRRSGEKFKVYAFAVHFHEDSWRSPLIHVHLYDGRRDSYEDTILPYLETYHHRAWRLIRRLRNLRFRNQFHRYVREFRLRKRLACMDIC